MAINVEVRDIATGRPVKPDFNPRIQSNKLRNAIRRADVKSFREMSEKNNRLNISSPRDIGSKAIKIARQFASGKIDILT